MARENPIPAWTSRSHSVLLPEPAGPARIRSSGLAAMRSVGEGNRGEEETVGGKRTAHRAGSFPSRQQPLEKIAHAPGLGAEPDGEDDADIHKCLLEIDQRVIVVHVSGRQEGRGREQDKNANAAD